MSDDSHSDVDPEDSNVQEASLLLPVQADAQPTNANERVHALRRPPPERRQSSLSQPLPNGVPRTPRTTNRVRFNVEERDSSEYEQNGRMAEPGLQSEEEDYFSHNASADERRSTTQRAPLLTGIEAPSVTVATDFNTEDLLENSRPKSGMRSAFMNMANSIMYASHHHDQSKILAAPAANIPIVVRAS